MTARKQSDEIAKAAADPKSDEAMMNREIEAATGEVLKDEPEYDWDRVDSPADVEWAKRRAADLAGLGDEAIYLGLIEGLRRGDAEQIRDLKRQVAGWKALAEGWNHLLTAYRTGGQPPQKAFTLIERGKKLLGE